MLPNFLIVGAAKCGTTSLFHYLNQHPQVFIPEKKECFFFSGLQPFNGPRNDQAINEAIVHSLSEYQALFDGAGDKPLRGDVSHDYLYYYQRSIANIEKHLGNQVPIIIILRDPRERAFSHYKHHVKSGTTTDTSFQQALAKEQQRIEQGWSWNWHYTRASLYADSVEAYLNAFAKVKVYFFDDLAKDAGSLVRDMYEFIGADPDFQPELRVENPGVSIRNPRLNRFLRGESVAKELAKRLLRTVGLSAEQISALKKKTMSANTGAKESLDEDVRKRLTALFETDVKRLESLLDADLGHWRR